MRRSLWFNFECFRCLTSRRHWHIVWLFLWLGSFLVGDLTQTWIIVIAYGKWELGRPLLLQVSWWLLCYYLLVLKLLGLVVDCGGLRLLYCELDLTLLTTLWLLLFLRWCLFSECCRFCSHARWVLGRLRLLKHRWWLFLSDSLRCTLLFLDPGGSITLHRRWLLLRLSSLLRSWLLSLRRGLLNGAMLLDGGCVVGYSCFLFGRLGRFHTFLRFRTRGQQSFSS